jgi:hypothetical protein
MSGTTVTSSATQWLRACSLVVGDMSGNGIELAGPDQPNILRIRFNTEYPVTSTPARCHIRVYNLAPSTVQYITGLARAHPAGVTSIPVATSAQVILKAGYQENFGELFRGQIYQMRVGKESNVDSYLDIFAADGDEAHGWATARQSLSAGYTAQDVWNYCGKTMQPWQITTGQPHDGLSTTPSPRGRVLFGMTREILRQHAATNNYVWNINGGQLQGYPKFAVRPGQVIVVNAYTGQIGTPEQTDDGITVTCLLNPAILWGSQIKLNNTEVARLLLQSPGLNAATSPNVSHHGQTGYLPPTNTDGLYTVLHVSHVGDTRGQEWYSRFTCLSLDPTALVPTATPAQEFPPGVMGSLL